jgi:hypothetical protein
MNYDELKSTLQANVANVTFTKKNGDKRVLNCTLIPDYLPAIEVKEGEEKAERKVNTDALAVWDLENKGWRSFRLDTLENVEIISA